MDPREELAMLEELERLEAEENAAQAQVRNSPVDQRVVKEPPVYTAGIQAAPERITAVSDNPLQTFREGVGSGLVRMGRGGTNVLVKTMRAMQGSPFVPVAPQMPEFASDEAIRKQDELDAALSATSEGGQGQFVGEAAASLPLGLAPRVPVESLATVPRLARTLAGPTVRSSLEGSITGAAASDPGSQKEGAAGGALGGAVLTKLGQALKRTVGGLGQPGEAAGHLEQFAEQHGKDVFIPAAQAIPDNSDITSRLVKTLYKEVLPLVPGASGRIKAQGKKLAEDVREIALNEADYKGILTPEEAADPQTAVIKLRKVLDDEVSGTVKKYTYRVPPRDQVVKKIEGAMPDVDDVTKNKIATLVDETITRFASNKPTLAGVNLLNARQDILRKIPKLKGPEQEAAEHAVKIFDDVIEHRLTLGNSKIMRNDLERWKATQGPSEDLSALERAVQKSEVTRGKFTPSQLVKSAGASDTQRHLGQTAHEVLSENLGSPSPAGRMAAYGALGTLGYFGSPVALGGVVGGGNALATELAQDVLLGRTASQQALIDLLRRNPGKLRTFGTAARGGATAEIGDE